MFLALIIISLIAPLMLVVKDFRLRKVMLVFMTSLLVFTFATERFGSYIPMGAVLVGMPALVLAASATTLVHFMTRERWFLASLIAAVLANAVVLYIYQFMLATPCTAIYPNCLYHTVTFDVGILASFALFVYAHWLGWLRDEVIALAPVKVTKRNSRRRQSKTHIEVIVEHLDPLKRPITIPPVHKNNAQ